MPDVTWPCPPFWECSHKLTINTFGVGFLRIHQEGITMDHFRGDIDMGSACNWDQVVVPILKKSGPGDRIDQPGTLIIQVWYGAHRPGLGDSADRVISRRVGSTATMEILSPDCMGDTQISTGADVYDTSLDPVAYADPNLPAGKQPGSGNLVIREADPGLFGFPDLRGPGIDTALDGGSSEDTWEPPAGNGDPEANGGLLDNPVLAAVAAFLAVKFLS